MKNKRNKNLKFRDSDADGLTDADEINLGTNPKKQDTDDDGCNDYEEVNVYGTDPLNPDTDGDGIKDGDEIKRNRNPKGPGMLKNLFIPSVYNNFKPLALHPKRIAFYSLSAILFKAILVITVMILPVEAWLTPNVLYDQSRKIVTLTNTIRENLKLTPLRESDKLNQAAFAKAEDMLIFQYFAHTGPNSKSLADWLKQQNYVFQTAGENLAMGFSSPEDVVNGWTRSQTHYSNMINPEFKEIGVGMVSGLYEKVDTTFVAQYFGTPFSQPVEKEAPKPAAVEPAAVKPAPEPVDNLLGEKVNEPAPPVKTEVPVIVKTEIKEPEIVAPVETAPETEPIATAPETTSAVEAEETASTSPATTADTTPPSIDQIRSKLYIDQPQGKSEKIVRAEIYLSADTKSAQINFNNYFINLTPSTGELWTGQTIIFEEDQEEIFEPVVLATVTATDQSGNRATADINWDNVKPAKTTLLKQYYFIKQHQSPYTMPLFNITSIFYKIILLIASVSLALNILIKIKKQYPRIILSTLGLISLLVILIII